MESSWELGRSVRAKVARHKREARARHRAKQSVPQRLIRKITFARERGLVFKFNHVAQNPERTSPDRPFPDHAMPCSYQIDAERDIVRVEASGTLSDADLHSLHQSVFADPRFHPGIRVLGDYQRVDQLEISATRTASLARSVAFSPDARRAFVVGPGMTEAAIFLYRAENPDANTRSFRSRAEAVEWLNAGLPAARHIV